jgi:hypothetical protein
MRPDPARTRRRGARGNTILELSVVLVPLFGLLFGIIDFSFAIFVRSTIEHSVREGVRYAATYQLKPSKCQVESVKQVVQDSAMGFLSGSRADLIKVRFFNPEADVSGNYTEVVAGGNAVGNIVEVSVEGYNHNWLVPLYWGKDPMRVNVRSADRLEGLGAGVSPPCQ